MKLCNLFSFWISSAQPQGLWSQDFIFCTADPNDGSLLGLRLRAGLCYSCLCIYRTESNPTERITSPQSSSCVAVDSAFSQAPTITSSQPWNPNKTVVLHVTVAQSSGPLRLLLSKDATVEEVIKETLALYAKEGRKPLLSNDPTSFGLHYSQFSIDCKYLNLF